MVFVLMTILTGITCTDWDLVEQVPPDPVFLEYIGLTDTSVTLRWTRSQEEFFDNYKVYYSTDNNSSVDITDNLIDSLSFPYDTIVTVWGLKAYTLYNFRVYVTNTDGLMSGSNPVTVTTFKDINSPLELIQPDSVHDVGEHQVMLRWRKKWIDTSNVYKVYYDSGTTVDTLHDTSVTIINDTCALIRNLQRATVYTFKVFIDRNGILAAGSNPVTVKTKSGHPHPVTITKLQAQSDTSVQIIWSMSSDTDFNQYIIRFDTVQHVDTFSSFNAQDTNHFCFIDRISDTAAVIKKLYRSKKHWFCVYVQDKDTFSVASAVDTITTGSGIPDSSILRVVRDSITDTSVILTWSQNSDADFHRYVLFVCKDSLALPLTGHTLDTANQHIDTLIPIPASTTTSWTVTPLLRNTVYWFALFVQDSAGLVSTGTADSATTNDGYPEAVTLDSVIVTPDTAIILKWSTPGTICNFSRYEIYCKAQANDVDSGDILIDTINTQNTVRDSIDHLCAYDTVYTFRIYTVAKNDKSIKTGSNRRMTFPVLLRHPTAICSTSIQLYWSKSITPHDFSSYNLYRSTNTVFPTTPIKQITNKHVTSHTDTGLDVSWTTFYYCIYHRAEVSGGNNEELPSNIIRVNRTKDGSVTVTQLK